MFGILTIGALLSTTATAVLLVIALLGKSFLLSTPFSYSPTGDLTPTNKTFMQLYFTHGETYLDDTLRPSSSCTASFTPLTCNLLTGSAVLIGLGLIMAVLTFIFLFLSRRGGQSKVHGSYLTTAIITVVLLLIAYLTSTSASSRLLDSELPDAQSRSLTDGILQAVKSKVVDGINEKWTALNKAADGVQWRLMAEAGVLKDSKCFVDPNAATDVLTTCLKGEGRDVDGLTESGYSTFHNISVVKAFNQATNLSLPETVTPVSIHKMIETKGYEIGNGTFKIMSATIDKTVHDNIRLTTGLGYACLIGGLIASFIAMLLGLLVFRNRYGIKEAETTTKAKI